MEIEKKRQDYFNKGKFGKTLHNVRDFICPKPGRHILLMLTDLQVKYSGSTGYGKGVTYCDPNIADSCKIIEN